MKWANGDVMVQLASENPALEVLLEAHLQEIDLALALAMQPIEPPQPGGGGIGAGEAMKNSNQEAGGAQNADDNRGKPKGTS